MSGFTELFANSSLRETYSLSSPLFLSLGFSFRHLKTNQYRALWICGCSSHRNCDATKQFKKNSYSGNIPVMGHGLEHSWVGPSCTLVKEWGEAIDAPLEDRLLCSWRRRCYLGSMALPQLRSAWNNKQQYERSKQQLKLALKHTRQKRVPRDEELPMVALQASLQPGIAALAIWTWRCSCALYVAE